MWAGELCQQDNAHIHALRSPARAELLFVLSTVSCTPLWPAGCTSRPLGNSLVPTAETPNQSSAIAVRRASRQPLSTCPRASASS